MNWKVGVLTGVATAALAYLYLQFVWTVAVQFLPSVSVIGEVIIVTMLARVATAVFWPRLRRASPMLVADVFSIEVFVLPVLGALSYLTGNAAYTSVMVEVFVSWLAALLVLSPSVMIFRYTRSMYNGLRLSVYLPASAFIFGLMESLVGIQPSGASGEGLKGLLTSFIGNAAGLFGSSGGETFSGGVAAASVLAFFAVALYAVGVGEERAAPRSPGLLLALAGILAAVLWGVGATSLASSPILVFTAPTAGIGGALWWSTRERKT